MSDTKWGYLTTLLFFFTILMTLPENLQVTQLAFYLTLASGGVVVSVFNISLLMPAILANPLFDELRLNSNYPNIYENLRTSLECGIATILLSALVALNPLDLFFSLAITTLAVSLFNFGKSYKLYYNLQRTAAVRAHQAAQKEREERLRASAQGMDSEME